MDNTIRLYLLGIAVQCIGLHPMAGGGSRSFSWECFRFGETTAQGARQPKPELVHNEWLQSATDYGLVGAGLLIGLLGSLALAAILRLLFEDSSKERDHRDAWRIGALAALAGILVQSCFSFVFHLMPGILLLGISWDRCRARPTNPSVHGRSAAGFSVAGCDFLRGPAVAHRMERTPGDTSPVAHLFQQAEPHFRRIKDRFAFRSDPSLAAIHLLSGPRRHFPGTRRSRRPDRFSGTR